LANGKKDGVGEMTGSKLKFAKQLMVGKGLGPLWEGGWEQNRTTPKKTLERAKERDNQAKRLAAGTGVSLLKVRVGKRVAKIGSQWTAKDQRGGGTF